MQDALGRNLSNESASINQKAVADAFRDKYIPKARQGLQHARKYLDDLVDNPRSGTTKVTWTGEERQLWASLLTRYLAACLAHTTTGYRPACFESHQLARIGQDFRVMNKQSM